MKRNNLKDVVYIGDTLGDFLACQEVNVPFIYASYGFGKVTEARWKIDNPSELITTINHIIK
jgi:phosphoglycolate phosphatase